MDILKVINAKKYPLFIRNNKIISKTYKDVTKIFPRIGLNNFTVPVDLQSIDSSVDGGAVLKQINRLLDTCYCIEPALNKANVRKFVVECMVCQQNKGETIKTPWPLQPLATPS